MDQKILWAVNHMPKTEDKNLPIMGLEEIKRQERSTKASRSTARLLLQNFQTWLPIWE